tara:strand:- start:1055 stop:1459 length:405 start_codon:yes stop_codon:yes gene_type:complete
MVLKISNINILKFLLVTLFVFFIVKILNIKNNKLQEGFDSNKNDALDLDVKHLNGELKINDNREDYLDGIINIKDLTELSKLKYLLNIPQTDLTKDNLNSNIDNIINELDKYDTLINSLKSMEDYVNKTESTIF